MARRRLPREGQNTQTAARLMGEVDSRVHHSDALLAEMVGSMTAIRDSSRQVAKISGTRWGGTVGRG
jgi:methyl-accepting chemotaxis protein